MLDETQAAIARILAAKGFPDAADRARRARSVMDAAFEEATVRDFDDFLSVGAGLPDPKDVHVVAAALKIRATTIVTDNLRDFPAAILAPLNIEARSPDAFIADTIALDPGKAVAALKRMRERFRKPEMTPERLLLEMEFAGLTEAVDVLRPHVRSL